jgi:hypothetical protein
VVPGEQFLWQVNASGMTAGELAVAVGVPGILHGQRVLIMRARASSAGMANLVRDETVDFVTQLDLRTGTPLYQQSESSGRRASRTEVRFAAGGMTIASKASGRPERTVQQTLPRAGETHDLYSFIAAMRQFRPGPGRGAELAVLARSRVWRCRVVQGASEMVTTPLGTFRAVRLDGEAQRMTTGYQADRAVPPRRFTMWYSEDSRRLPLRFSAETIFGPVRVELATYQPPSGNAAVGVAR